MVEKVYTERQMARMVERALGEETYEFHGSRATPYIARVDGTGRISCDCPGWINKRLSRPRGCKHTRELILRYSWKTRLDGDEVYREQ